MTREHNIVIAGVGGQGIILASEVVAEMALKSNLDVKKSDVHGMAQRGGSVVSFLRLGPEVFSPLIPAGKANLMIAFERLESLRWLGYLRPGATILLNDQKITPPTVASGTDKYPADIDERLADFNLLKLDGPKLAGEAGNARAVNSIMLGALSTAFDFGDGWIDEIKAKLPEKLHSVNEKAFELGRAAADGFDWKL